MEDVAVTLIEAVSPFPSGDVSQLMSVGFAPLMRFKAANREAIVSMSPPFG